MADIAALRVRNDEFWAAAAPGWIRHADRHDRDARPLGAAAQEWLALQPGEHVLDVGCGCGGTTAALAATGAAAVGIDLSTAMVATAARRFPHLPFVAGDIETAPTLPGEPYDAVFSRMVLMLLPDPVAGLAAIRRRLRPDGRLAATVFRDAASNGWLAAALLGAAAHVGPLPPLPIGASEPGPFAFENPARVRDILAAAGFSAIDIEAHDVEMVTRDDSDAVAEWLIEMGPAGAAYRAATTADQRAARAGAVKLFERYRAPSGGYRFTSGIWLITARHIMPMS